MSRTVSNLGTPPVEPLPGIIGSSAAMLEVARRKGVYEDLRQMTMGEPLEYADDAFDAAVGLSLDDGWLDLESAAFGEWSVGTDGEFTKLDLHVAREPLPAADFEREFGLTGVDVSQVECAQLTAYSRYEIQEGGLMTQGSVEVLGGPCDSVFSHFGNQTLAFVSWCDGCEYPQRPSFNP